MAGHIEKFCGQKQLTSKEKMLAKYSEVCHRCGNKGHTSRECPRNTISCRVCGEDHRPGECSKEDNTLESMIRTKKEETSEFAKRRLRAEMAEKERRMAAAKGSGSAGFGTGVEGKGSSGVGLIGSTRQPVIQVKRKENPSSWWCPRRRPTSGWLATAMRANPARASATRSAPRLRARTTRRREKKDSGGCWEITAATTNSETARGLALGLAEKDF